jgi:polysaccharide export outer membrane protein
MTKGIERSSYQKRGAKTVARLIAWTTLFLLVFAAYAAGQDDAEPYVIGYGDVLSVRFWQEPTLDSEVRVGEDGMITLPVIGRIKAAGLTTTDLAQKIVEQMTFYHSPVSQATVAVTEFNSRAILVSGEVVTPGRQSYERIPDLWRVILDAGGPTDRADLSRVRIIRQKDEKPELMDVDLLSIVASGDISEAPALQPGDLVHVPAAPFGVSMEPGERAEGGRNVYFIFGSVPSPGVRNLEAGMDVLDAIALAGGMTQEADMKNVRVVIKGQEYSTIVKIDMEKYLNEGSVPRFILHAEDTIVIPARKRGPFASVLGTLGQVVPFVTAVGTLILLLE